MFPGAPGSSSPLTSSNSVYVRSPTFDAFSYAGDALLPGLSNGTSSPLTSFNLGSNGLSPHGDSPTLSAGPPAGISLEEHKQLSSTRYFAPSTSNKSTQRRGRADQSMTEDTFPKGPGSASKSESLDALPSLPRLSNRDTKGGTGDSPSFTSRSRSRGRSTSRRRRSFDSGVSTEGEFEGGGISSSNSDTVRSRIGSGHDDDEEVDSFPQIFVNG